MLTAVLLMQAAVPAIAAAPTPADYRADALSVERLIQANYAYLDRFAGERVPTSDVLSAEAVAVHDARSLLRYTARALLALGDQHALATRNVADDWAPPPSGSDLWLEWREGRAVVTAVRQDGPADAAGIQIGDRLTAISGVPVAQAVEEFWRDLGLPLTAERAEFGLLQLAAGRRDRPRELTFDGAGQVTLPAFQPPSRRVPLSIAYDAGTLVVRINNSLGEEATIAAFDEAMASAAPSQPIRIDLRDTPNGGNTTVARAIMGWFVDDAAAYQIHSLPREERDTGVPRQWVEQVLSRLGKHHIGPVEVRVGRWTGSMGEGLAIGFQAMGATVCGGPMAGLRGAVYDIRLEHSGLVFKLPVERLTSVSGVPRERVVFAPCAVSDTPPLTR